MSDSQLRKMQALMRERGIAERWKRLELCSVAIGRPIASSRQLTSSEAARVISLLELNLSQPHAAPGESEPPIASPEATPVTAPNGPAAAEAPNDDGDQEPDDTVPPEEAT